MTPMMTGVTALRARGAQAFDLAQRSENPILLGRWWAGVV